MDWGSAKAAEDGKIKVPTRWLQLHYYEALNLLFRLENALRLMVYVALKNEYLDKWSAVSITSEEGEGTVASIASRRRAQAGAFGYLGYPVSSPLLYLTTGELTRLITSEAYWPLFRPYFPGAKNIVTTKFDEINAVRNAFAHFRPIRPDDVDTAKQSSKHILTTVEETLYQLLECADTVPTNTSRGWYTELKVLGTAHCTLGFKQSADEAWVRVDINYKSPTLRVMRFGDLHYSYTVLNLSAPAIIKHYVDLRSIVTYVMEDVSYARMSADTPPAFGKRVSFGFSQRRLEENASKARSQLESLLAAISQETELIQQDNLARGDLIRSASTSATLKEGEKFGYAEQEPLASGFREDDPAEWWGDISLYTRDFISSTHRYPWMPTDIAQVQFPF